MEPIIRNEMIEYIPEIEKYIRKFDSLTDLWDLMKCLAEITCPKHSSSILLSLNETQVAFQELQEKLIDNLLLESIKKINQEMTSKAQVAIDILIRNLFERTADVGFLATDDDIRSFLGLDKPSQDDFIFIKQRLSEYVKKYSVYDEIILLDTCGHVKTHLNDSNPVSEKIIDDSFIDAVLETDEPFTEFFGKSALEPNKTNSLIYACKIKESFKDDAKTIGVLCLCFRFENEMEGIFRNLITKNDRSLLMILDSDGYIMASSDESQLPLGKKMEKVLGDTPFIIDIHGRDYFAKTAQTKGYQGYLGLGWLGHIALPCDTAFKQKASNKINPDDKETIQRVIKNSNVLLKELSDIANQAEEINIALQRIVWNGQLISSKDNNTNESDSLRPLMNEINKIGTKTSKIFADSIKNLQETVFSATLNDVQFMASLAIDIMDRNLYERANDCRWWALTTEFRRLMLKEVLTDEDKENITEILTYINALYTVYTNIFLYDRNGNVIASSNGTGAQTIKLAQSYIRDTLLISDSQKYIVSDFCKTNLYGDRYTYIYNASVTSLEHDNKIIGGIGLVFDSEPQFAAMLEDSLPEGSNTFAVFTDRHKTIISSNESDHPVGGILDIDDSFFSIPNGQAAQRIITYRGKYYAVGCTVSNGYREYKNSNDYKNDVISFVFYYLGEECENSDGVLSDEDNVNDIKFRNAEDGPNLATFIIGNDFYAVDASAVIQAQQVSKEDINKYNAMSSYFEGYLKFNDCVIPIIDLRLLFGLTDIKSAKKQIIVVDTAKGLIGLIVDTLHSVCHVSADSINELTENDNYMSFVKGLAFAALDNNKSKLIALLDLENMIAN